VAAVQAAEQREAAQHQQSPFELRALEVVLDVVRPCGRPQGPARAPCDRAYHVPQQGADRSCARWRWCWMWCVLQPSKGPAHPPRNRGLPFPMAGGQCGVCVHGHIACSDGYRVADLRVLGQSCQVCHLWDRCVATRLTCDRVAGESRSPLAVQPLSGQLRCCSS